MVALAGLHEAGAAQNDVMMQPDAEAAIRLTSINSNWDGLGWQPVLVRIENRAQQARTWKFDFNVGAAHYRGGETVMTPAVITVPSRGTSEVVVFVAGPGRSSSGSYNRTVWWGADVSGPGVAIGQVSGLSGSRQLDFAQIATTSRMEEAVRRLMPAAPTVGHGSLPYEVESIDPVRWPADWRVWSSFSHLVLAGDDYDRLDGARRNALREWVAQGGVLWIVPDGGRPGGETPKIRHGLGWIHSRLDTLWASTGKDAILRAEPWQTVAELITSDDRGDWELDQPIVALIIFLVIFGIVVGPINVFVFAPVSRRQRLFVTVPALSLGASLLLGVVIVAKDGFGGEGARRSLVVLLPGENKAAVFQQQVARTGVLLRKEFALPADTSISLGSGGSRGVTGSRALERAGDTASGEWFTSRAMQTHDLRRITPTRARVELVDGGVNGRAPVVQSSVTTVLRDFRYVDAGGKRWAAESLPPGTRVTLSPVTTEDRGDVPGFFRAYGGATDLAPLNTHASIRWKEETIIYTGRVEAARQP
ncbi:MAG: hypothetical protein K0R17_2418 [Rariglobus sp.]|jgi:hypothetical protein|nr:hypothetical protein [Rariglobus sp.]